MINTRAVYSGFFIIVIAIVLWVFWSPPGIYTDSAWGFNAWINFQNGASLNHVSHPDQNNIAKDVQGYMTHWTPGQYVVPGIFMSLFHFTIGEAIIATVILFTALGLLGFYGLYRKLGYSAPVVAITMLVLISQKYTSLPFSFYNGGEVLLFGFVPWVLLYVLGLKKKNVFFFTGLFLLHLFGFFLKSSYLIFAIAVTALIAVQASGVSLKMYKAMWAKRSEVFLAGLSLVVSYFIFWKYFLSRGHNPSSTAGFSAEAMDVVFPLASPVGAAFSLDDIINRLFYFPGAEQVISFPMWILYLPIAAFSLLLVFKFSRKTLGSLVFFVFLLTYVILLAVLYLFDADISYEFRHFRIVGLIMLPLCVDLAFSSRSWLKYSLLLLIAVSSVFGILSFAQRKVFAQENYFQGNSNFLYAHLKQSAFDKLQTLDATSKQGNILLYTPHPEINLELKNLRLITQHSDFIPLENLQKQQFHGRVDTLYVLLPLAFKESGKSQAILESFVDYDHFQLWYEDDAFQIFKSF